MPDAIIQGRITELPPVDGKVVTPDDGSDIQLENVIKGHTKFPRLFIPIDDGIIHLENMNGDVMTQKVSGGHQYIGVFRKFLTASDAAITSITVKS